MKIRYQRAVASILAAAALALPLAACKKDPRSPVITTESKNPGTETEAPAPNPLPMGLARLDTAGKPIISAAFAKSPEASELAAEHRLTKKDPTAPDASLRIVWNADGLYLTLRHTAADRLRITLNTHTEELPPEGGETALALRAEELGIRIADLGQRIPLSVSLSSGNAVSGFDGFVQLVNAPAIWSDSCRSADAFATGIRIVGSPGASLRGMDVGIAAREDGIRLHDRYSLAKNAARLRIEASASGLSALGDAVRPLLFSCDLTVADMPVFTPQLLSATDAEGLVFSLAAGAGGRTACFGLYNTGTELRFFVNDGSGLRFADTGAACGETFRLGVLIAPNGRVTLLVNGYEITSFENAAQPGNGSAENTLRFFWQRNGRKAESDADSFDATVGSLTVSAESTTYLADTVSDRDLFGGKDAVNVLDGVLLAPEKLLLPDTLTSRKYGLNVPAVWVSSNPAVLAQDGTVTPPRQAGAVVDLTLYLSDGTYLVSERRFRFFVRAEAPDSRVLRIVNDRNPYEGSGEAADTCFSFSSGSSLIYDMGSVTEIGRVTVDSLPDSPVSPLRDFLSLYVSDDNRTWRRVSDFSLLSRGTGFTVYNISETARYIKLHNSEALSPLSTAIGSLQSMMTAAPDDGSWLSAGSWAKSTVTTLRNTGTEPMRNRILCFTTESLGISPSELRADRADIRFTVGKTLLPHYRTGNSFYVRVPEIPAESTVELRVLYSNPLASSVSDGNETFEVRSGTRHVTDKPTGFWRTSVAEMPDGSLLMMGVGNSAGTVLAAERSTDGGFSWSATQTIPCTAVPDTHTTDGGGGFVTDRARGVVFYFSFTIPRADSGSKIYELRIFKSTDSGRSWTGPVRLAGQPDYVINYADGIVLSSADDTGPNVDYVFPVILEGGSSSLYSRDGGRSWQLSTSLIKPEPSLGSDDFFEGGNTEATILEQKSGILMMYMRCQMYGNAHFGVAHSEDGGTTWERFSRLSNVYAPNTQPILDRLEDGTPVLLWGGNHSMGTTSHLRFPLSLASSGDDGEVFRRILDASEQTFYANRDPGDRYDITNPDIVIYRNRGLETAYIITKHYAMLIEDFDRYLKETKGVFDSFENRTAAQEGWLVTKGSADIGTTGATDGLSALRILPGSAVTRSIPGSVRGCVMMDLCFDIGGTELKLAFQPAYNDTPERNALTFFTVDADGVIRARGTDGRELDTGLKLTKGNNTVVYRFDGTSREATLTVNGKSAAVLFDTAVGDQLCSVVLTTGSGTSVCLDRFTVIPED